jgi:hypothetical protein
MLTPFLRVGLRVPQVDWVIKALTVLLPFPRSAADAALEAATNRPQVVRPNFMESRTIFLP